MAAEFMAALAMRCLTSDATLLIHLDGYRLKMRRITTTNVPAQMVNLEAIWNWADELGVSPTVNKPAVAAAETRVAISPVVDSCCPCPTQAGNGSSAWIGRG